MRTPKDGPLAVVATVVDAPRAKPNNGSGWMLWILCSTAGCPWLTPVCPDAAVVLDLAARRGLRCARAQGHPSTRVHCHLTPASPAAVTRTEVQPCR